MTANAPEFSIARVFDAPRDLAWKTFTEPEGMRHGFNGTFDQLAAYLAEERA